MTTQRRLPLTFPRLLALALSAAAISASLGCRGGDGDGGGRTGAGLPAPGSDAYEQTARRFYRGLAQLEVGMIDAAIEELSQATALAPGEPASWADLGLAHLRLGAYEEAAAAIGQAAALAPDDSRIAFLEAQLATVQGDREQGIAHLRRAVELDPGNLPARTALAEAVEDSGAPGADDEAQRLLEELVDRAPDNVALLVERARLAAKRGDGALLADSIARLAPLSEDWPPQVVEQLGAVEEAAGAGDFPGAARALAFLRNVLVQVPSYLESRAAIAAPGELIAEPIVRFVALPPPPSTPSPADLALAYSALPVGDGPAAWTTLAAFSPDGEAPPVIFAAGGGEISRVDAAGAALDFPGGEVAAHGLAALDWNADFRLDLAAAGPAGVRLFLQGEDGGFAPAPGLRFDAAATGAWPADVEMDGDLDLVVGVAGAAPTVLQNDGDGTWTPTEPFAGVAGIVAFAWSDLDGDADPDAAMVDGDGGLHVFANLQAGRFERLAPPPSAVRIAALAVGDADADGRLDLVTLADGVIRRASLAGDGSWREAAWTDWSAAPATAAPGAVRLLLADLDNNGALDLVASAPGATAVWLADEERALQPLPAAVDAEVFAAADFDGDGQLDLAGLADGRPVRLIGQGTLGYHYHLVRPRAVERAGDQRINSFGLGGLVEVRAGLLVQEQPIAGPAVHFGLGAREAVDVTRIVWPNGVAQAEFDPAVDQAVVAEQRLKGSCPWLFADGGDGMAFVTDFLWRSPLGLKINATDTAGVTQTEDWVKIPGDRLAEKDGFYHLAITAELWETHYLDHLSLLVVDHPPDVEVWVDERFVPTAPPALAVHATGAPRPVAGAWDEDGREVTDLVAAVDGRYLDTFEAGRYQGVAEDHFVEIDLGAPIRAGRPAWLLAHGWIYPTDSSINVAIGQNEAVAPRGLSLEAQDAAGRWRVVAADLGFPAGKSKTVLLDLGMVARAGVPGARRLRLRTNLEVYWDALAVAEATPQAELATRRLAPDVAELRFRGYSVTRGGRREPEVPVYERIANVTPRWRDLVGHYTRWGDVRELLARVEDRYVIMNAGDELVLRFAAPPPPAAGWKRDFVLIGDGWEKDGDYNTTSSATVLPLPAHGESDYPAVAAPWLEDDPVFRRHPEDWVTYHTRYVAPRAFLAGLGGAVREGAR